MWKGVKFGEIIYKVVIWLVLFFSHMCDLSVNPSPSAVKDAKYNSKRHLVFLTRETRKRKSLKAEELWGRPWKGDS